MFHVNIANGRLKRTPHSHALFLLEELIIHFNVCGSQTNFQRFHNCVKLQGTPFHESVIVMEFIADDMQGFIDWHISEEADYVKTNKNILGMKVNGLQQLYENGPNFL
jgi:hypothetical protein